MPFPRDYGLHLSIPCLVCGKDVLMLMMMCSSKSVSRGTQIRVKRTEVSVRVLVSLLPYSEYGLHCDAQNTSRALSYEPLRSHFYYLMAVIWWLYSGTLMSAGSGSF